MNKLLFIIIFSSIIYVIEYKIKLSSVITIPLIIGGLSKTILKNPELGVGFSKLDILFWTCLFFCGIIIFLVKKHISKQNYL